MVSPSKPTKLLPRKWRFQTFQGNGQNFEDLSVWGIFCTSEGARNHAMKRKNLHYINNLAGGGWDGRIRTYGTLYQKQLPYHLATSQRVAVNRTKGRNVQDPFWTKMPPKALTCDETSTCWPQRLGSINIAPLRPPASTASWASAVSASSKTCATGQKRALFSSASCKCAIAASRCSCGRI